MSGQEPAVSTSVEAEKSALRHRLLAARDAAGPLEEASAAVCRRLASLPELAGREVVLGYAAQAREISVDAALRRLLGAGTTVCLPWVEGVRLGLGAVGDLDRDVAPGWRGIREPRHPRQPVPPHAVELVIVPGVGFDVAGNRLGYGGGHFDRLLGRLRRGVPVIGVALEDQVVTRIPVADHDRPVDVVLTPERTLRPARL